MGTSKFSAREMKSFFLIYFLKNIFASSHDYCQEDEWVGDDCQMYKKCIFDPDGLNVRRTVFCVEGSKVKAAIGLGMGRELSCEPEADIPCDQKCGQPCSPDPEDSNDVTSDDPQPENTDFSGPIECRPGTVDPINCFKFRLCMHGRMVTVHCNEGLVHSGYKKECQAPATLPAGHACGTVQPTQEPVCLEGTVESDSCTTFRLCLKGKFRLVHCNAGLVHDGISANCVVPESLTCDHKCGIPCPTVAPTCIENSVHSISCTHFKICRGGQWKTATCNPGMVHDGFSAACMDQSLLPCGGKCASPCPTPTTPECLENSVIGLSCNQFKKCLGGTWKTATCNEGLVHVGTSGICVSANSLPCGGECALSCPPSCVNGAVIGQSCTQFRKCLLGNWKTMTCNAGLVHSTINPGICVAPNTLPCDSQCGLSCPVAECKEGDWRPDTCRKMKTCHNGKWKTSFCKRGLVNLGFELKCVDPATLPCGSKCAAECPTCVEGAVRDLSCGKFSLCKNGEWKTSHCNEGLVHLPGSGAVCVPKSQLACDTVCADECSVTPICEEGVKSALSCSHWKMCIAGDWIESHCQEGQVWLPEIETCVDQSILACHHKCSIQGGECPPVVCPITECPPCATCPPPPTCPDCPTTVEYQCPCNDMKSTIQRINEDINILMSMQMEDLGTCVEQPKNVSRREVPLLNFPQNELSE